MNYFNSSLIDAGVGLIGRTKYVIRRTYLRADQTDKSEASVVSKLADAEASVP